MKAVIAAGPLLKSYRGKRKPQSRGFGWLGRVRLFFFNPVQNTVSEPHVHGG